MISTQEANSYSYVVVRHDGKTKQPALYRGEKAVSHFINSLKQEVKDINEILEEIQPIVMSKEDKDVFKNTTICAVCNKGFTHEDYKVKHHDHITGKFIAGIHNSCNLQLRLKPGKTKILGVFHNLRGYDSHLIISTLGIENQDSVYCIPNNLEKFMTFSVGQLTFIDPMQFMAESLEKLSNNF